MASARQIAANRRNAQKITGPKTPAGKERASRNAYRHGLRSLIAVTGARGAEVEQLARLIAGDSKQPTILAWARTAAEGALDIERVRRARAALIEQVNDRLAGAAEDPAGTEDAVRRRLAQLSCLIRYERRAASRRDKAL